MRLLKKIADIEIEDFPSHILENQKHMGELEFTKTFI
ncbi:hypothetical protein Gotri_012617 [Gossypium trilobum]|uniref:Uncharacterized protein n=1 Tax=Gossypium trilobum TaxID=34281 RepID=A0A7J9DRB4_9ROSI|nr:hypothetical protein [Gossypium trilobum]